MCTQKISVNISSDLNLNLIQIEIGFPLEYYIGCIEAKRRSELIIQVPLTEESKKPMSNQNDYDERALNCFK